MRKNLFTQVNINDQLPKTACLHCIERLEAHHELMEQFMVAKQRLNKSNSLPSSSVTKTAETSTSASSSPC